MFSPVGSPRVAPDPVVHAILGAPSVQLDGVVNDLGVAGVVRDDAAGVHRVEQTIRVQIGGDGAAGHDLGTDVVVALHVTEFRESDGGVVSNRGARVGVVVAVHARVDGRALHVDGLVLLASDIRDAVIEHPSVRGVCVATVATASAAAVDQGLDGGDDITLKAFGLNLDAVCDRGHGSVCPTRAAVHRNVLVQV